MSSTAAWAGLATSPIWPDGPAPGDDIVGTAVTAFLAAELAPLGIFPGATDGVAPAIGVGAIGTTAPHTIASPMLTRALIAAGLALAAARPFSDPDALVMDPDWKLGVVLSPWKRDLAARLGTLSPSAVATGVVDTVLRMPGDTPLGGAAGLLGVNTNSWAAQAVLELLAAGRTPDSVVLLGAGASARSVALAVRRLWPKAPLLVSARSAASAAQLAALADAEAVAPADVPDTLAGRLPTILVNSTTWGETPQSEAHPFPFPTDRLLGPGGAFFDLNNRLSELQAHALAAGCTVSSGTLMQRATHASRAAAVRAILTQEEPHDAV